MSIPSPSDESRAAHRATLRAQRDALYPQLADAPAFNPDIPAPNGTTAPAAAEDLWVVQPTTTAHIAFDAKWLLAPTLITFVEQVMKVTDWPAEFLAAPLLTICGSAIGTSRQLRINALWSERACLWVAAIGEPGSGKTPSLNFVLKPLLAMQRQWHKEWKDTHKDYETDLAYWEDQPKGKRGSKPEEPNPQRKALVSDVTIEALVNILADNPRGLALVRDELLGWLLSFNQYKSGGGADRQHWLSIYSGVDVLVERKGEQYSAFVHNPFVGIYGGIQPDKLPQLRRDAGDGLIDRFLIFFPQTKGTKTRKFDFATEYIAAYRRLLERLLSLEPGETEAGESVALAVNLTDEAFELFVEREAQLKQRAADEYLPKAIRTAYNKLGGQAARLALTLHQCQCADNPEKPQFLLTVETIQAAWSIVECSANHLNRSFGEMNSRPSDDRAARAVAWIIANGRTATARDLLRANVVSITKSSQATALIKDLGDRRMGVITTERKGGWDQIRITIPDDKK